MDLLKVASDLFLQQLEGQGLDADAVSSALGQLLGSGDGNIDLSGLLEQFNSGGLASVAQSLLQGGAGEGFSVEQLTQVFGESSLSDFAANIGLDSADSTQALGQMLPQLLNEGGADGLLDAVGGVEGLAGMASKLFR